jgi:hypothetical protein
MRSLSFSAMRHSRLWRSEGEADSSAALRNDNKGSCGKAPDCSGAFVHVEKQIPPLRCEMTKQ